MNTIPDSSDSIRRHVVLIILIAVGIGLLVSGVALIHLGPFNISPGENIVLSNLRLVDGTRYFVVGHRTCFLTEPYEVTLYKIEPDKRTSSYYLAFEDSYWWSCSLLQNSNSGEIEIRANDRLAARYLPAKDLVISDAYKIPILATSNDYVSLEAVLENAKGFAH